LERKDGLVPGTGSDGGPDRESLGRGKPQADRTSTFIDRAGSDPVQHPVLAGEAFGLGSHPGWAASGWGGIRLGRDPGWAGIRQGGRAGRRSLSRARGNYVCGPGRHLV